jgi:hypothetical protein
VGFSTFPLSFRLRLVVVALAVIATLWRLRRDFLRGVSSTDMPGEVGEEGVDEENAEASSTLAVPPGEYPRYVRGECAISSDEPTSPPKGQWC